jgi:hypothetical protein
MQCTVCRHHTPDDWAPLFAYEETPDAPFPANRGAHRTNELVVALPAKREIHYSFDWMRCANEKCNELTVRVNREDRRWGDGAFGMGYPSSWLAVPRLARARPVNPIVVEAQPEMARDYQEASMILELSPRMSAVLSRRILADLLEVYARLDNYRLSNRIDSFTGDSSHPRPVRENMHTLRSMADFAAHTKHDKDDQVVIIDITDEEAEWTLNIVDRLFEHFIVTPAKDAEMRASFNKKREAAGHNPLAELPADEPKDNP